MMALTGHTGKVKPRQRSAVPLSGGKTEQGSEKLGWVKEQGERYRKNGIPQKNTPETRVGYHILLAD